MLKLYIVGRCNYDETNSLQKFQDSDDIVTLFTKAEKAVSLQRKLEYNAIRVELRNRFTVRNMS